MENSTTQNQSEPSRPILLVGSILIVLGILLLLSNYMQSYWLLFSAVPFIGMALIIESIRTKNYGLTITGSLISGNSTGVLIFFLTERFLDVPQRAGWLILGVGMSWVMITFLSAVYQGRYPWWPLIPGVLISSAALPFLFNQLRLVDFVLYIVTTIGLVMLGSGMMYRIFGLIIPGSILLGIGPSIYLAWGTTYLASGLSKTGGMLVGFALGWAGITFFSRAVTSKFVWWPLIPCGVLATVGWGLYIGGNPGGSLSFIGNTGSMVLILLGIYLLLLQSDSKK
ncbi:MAG: hypothetical protein JEZ00_19330 [Anaerolineaceae bacterium]|nr:hypothetical protein [Anaerolineaceae bacterium]